jgi:hypothetical protein
MKMNNFNHSQCDDDVASPEVNQASIGEFQPQATLEEAPAAIAQDQAASEATHTAKKLRLKDVQFQDSKGSHSRYGVRSMGAGKGFGILDKLENRFLNLAAGSARRLDCYLALQNHDEDITL